MRWLRYEPVLSGDERGRNIRTRDKQMMGVMKLSQIMIIMRMMITIKDGMVDTDASESGLSTQEVRERHFNKLRRT